MEDKPWVLKNEHFSNGKRSYMYTTKQYWSISELQCDSTRRIISAIYNRIYKNNNKEIIMLTSAYIVLVIKCRQINAFCYSQLPHGVYVYSTEN